MPEIVQEYVSSRGQAIRIDPINGVLRGVKLLGLQSRNGRSYQEQALRQAMSLYEGAKVNVNHPVGDPLAARDYRDRLGVIRNVQLKPKEGLFGDLHYNPKHALAEQLAWDAEHSPENVGLSHNVLAQTVRNGQQLIVEAITKVQSVDLVADPATTQGLYEQADHVAQHNKVKDDDNLEETNELESDFEQSGLIEGNNRSLITTLESNLESALNEKTQLQESLRRYQIQERGLQLLAEHACATSLLPAELNQFLSEEFIASLSSFEEEQVTTALTDRISLLKLSESKAKHTAPQSVERSAHSSLVKGVVEETTESFVAAITRS